MSYIGNSPPIGTASEVSSVDTPNIAAGAITETRIATDAVTTTKILDANVTTAKLADNAVTTAKILDANVTAGKIASNAVTTAKILDSNVTTAKIADSNVTTAKILDANVTNAKLASNAVTSAKITDGSITLAKIADGIITLAKMASTSIATVLDMVNSTSGKVVTSDLFKGGLRGVESYTLLAERIASNTAALDFTSLITTEFDHYVFEIMDIVPVSASILQCWFSSDNGATWNITAGDYGRCGIVTYSGSSTTTNIASSSAPAIELTATVGIQAGTSINGTTKLFNPLNTTKTKFLTFNMTFVTAGDYGVYTGSGMKKSNLLAVNAIRFIMSTGNMATGTVRMYGIRKV